MNNSVIFLFIVIILLFIIMLSYSSKDKRDILPVSFIDDNITEHWKHIQNETESDPAVKQNLQIIEKANDMEFKRKLAGAPTICIFKPNKFLKYSYQQFIDTFTGLILPSLGNLRASNKTDNIGTTLINNQVVNIGRELIANDAVKLIDFNKIKPVDADKSVFYGVVPKLFNKARDQGACGSCWAYSGVTAIEAQVVKKYLIENPAYLSIQYYIDCVKDCKGCQGGFPLYVYEQVAKDGFVVWDDYLPYTAQQSKVCQPPRSKFPLKLQGMIVFAETDAAYFTADQINQAFQYQNLKLEMLKEDMIEKIKKILFNYGPISALIYVDDKMPYFSNGIYMTVDTKDGVKQRPNHAVVIAGYGINVYGEKYWVMRNSWGSEWGEDGYFPLSQDSPMCGFDIPVFDDIPPTL